MAKKSNLAKYKTISAGDMSQASITSDVTCIQWLDNIGIQCNFTGAPVGVFEVQVSADYTQDINGNVQDAGHWVTIASASTSGGSPLYFDLPSLSAPYIRVVYTKTSGTGSTDCFITAKVI